MKNKKAKFFCENCGAEVPEKAKVCKHCGKFFISVRCPNCGATGTSSEFKKGCTHCGYADVNSANGSGVRNILTENKVSDLKFIFPNRGNKAKTSDSSLPIWIYAVTTIFFVGTLIAVYGCLTSPIY